MTGITDAKIDAWFGNQELYRKHGMEHPAKERKVVPERRSRSPMLPGPRKVKNLDEELFEKWMDETHPIPPGETFFTGAGDVIYIKDEAWDEYQQYRPKSHSWWKSQVEGRWPDWVGQVLYDWPENPVKKMVSNPRGRGTMTGSRPWEKNASTVAPESSAKLASRGIPIWLETILEEQRGGIRKKHLPGAES